MKMPAMGLYHMQINVNDLNKSLEFYTGFLGMKIAFWAEPMVFLTSENGNDLLTLNPIERPVDTHSGGLQHFGFRVNTEKLEQVLLDAPKSGITILSTGSHGDGERYVYLEDPDGYIVELDAAE